MSLERLRITSVNTRISFDLLTPYVVRWRNVLHNGNTPGFTSWLLITPVISLSPHDLPRGANGRSCRSCWGEQKWEDEAFSNPVKLHALSEIGPCPGLENAGGKKRHNYDGLRASHNSHKLGSYQSTARLPCDVISAARFRAASCDSSGRLSGL
jgi:hypothetical protein